jgi:hypothetical protein
MPISINNTTLTFNDATTQTTAGQPGTVTSVATGNGLQGGTITTSGTLSVACPSVDTVGSYAMLFRNGDTGNFGPGATTAGSLQFSDTAGRQTSSASGTWRCMGNSPTNSSDGIVTLWCRVS